MKINLDKVIRSISIALDLAEISSIDGTNIIEDVSNINFSEHKFMHHAQRTTYICLEIASQLNLDENTKKLIYVSALLHDIGAANFLNMSHSYNAFIKEHCIIGANITKNFPILSNLSEIILYHHENYDGTGSMGLHEDDIPIESQIIRLADLVELLYTEKSPSFKQKNRIINWVNEHRGKIFSSQLVDAFINCSKKDSFWFNVHNIQYMEFILDTIAPNLNTYLDLDNFEKIAYIFSEIIDNKSKFTARHSRDISNLAYNVSKYLKYPEEKCRKMRIAGLLHDIGKLAIPSKILDKNSSLSPDEFSIIKSHVYYTKLILDRIGDIPDISEWASNHHEKLNGNGYPRSLSAEDISEESRIMAVCDIYQALTEDRPYRNGLNNERAFSIMDGMVVDGFICEKSLTYLKNSLGYRSGNFSES
ncbi:HD-GYP domain-containing protein [Clostridium tetanomorphum]|uniref:HD-GYP domain-containing protein n=1 Tax=Clostridium tetanomorphum TaxID=1553 RepID=A0A923J2B9_CLOTT|nr:HD-GYP domain-containing protein [Clostridium tetanomorphum]MBC2400106.1 HD-GYP domain-containing protein [Clostridium tetanomorphum]NRZ95921.1 putative nucleotidyltransferase with HDIG domain [Clostridium tetanomorphum]